MIIGTAGHVDHGKTSLVRALTGIDTDRLPEEKRRGITLELGFAHLALPSGQVAGVVDVPGHERFVRTMAAGAGGVDVVVLVVAADEGVKPQTREHLDICRLLGVRRGVVALTKADLVTERAWEERTQALAELTQGTFLEGAPVVPCSSKTGAGLEALKAALDAACRALAERASDGPLFLPIDRAFTLKGHGTVVTGTLLSGALRVDEPTALVPGGVSLRARGLQIHGKPVTVATAGQRVAVNVSGVDVDAVRRGMALVRAGEVEATSAMYVALELLPSAPRALPRRARAMLHLGTAQALAAVSLVGGELAPGQRGLARVTVPSPVAALADQRFILRGRTLAGGRVLLPHAPGRKKLRAEWLTPLLSDDPRARVALLLQLAGYQGLTEAALFAQSGLGRGALRALVAACQQEGLCHALAGEPPLFVHAERLGQLERRLRTALKAGGQSKESLRQSAGAPGERVFAHVLSTWVARGEAHFEGERVVLGATAQAAPLDARAQAIGAELDKAALAPPTVSELATRLRSSPAQVVASLQALVARGAAVKASEELYFASGAVKALEQRLVAYLLARREVTTQAFKELVGQSRKFTIALSEYFDREKVTLRVGDKRVLRKGARD